jgi:hypothetical protein
METADDKELVEKLRQVVSEILDKFEGKRRSEYSAVLANVVAQLCLSSSDPDGTFISIQSVIGSVYRELRATAHGAKGESN